MAQIARGSETDLGDGTMRVERVSAFTGRIRTMTLAVSPEQLARWRNGMLIQDAMPHLSADEREFLLTGATPGEFGSLFSDD